MQLATFIAKKHHAITPFAFGAAPRLVGTLKCVFNGFTESERSATDADGDADTEWQHEAANVGTQLFGNVDRSGSRPRDVERYFFRCPIRLCALQ